MFVVACAALAWGQTAIADWPKGSADVNGISKDKLRAMETAVRGGDFKKISSVLIARHGKLVYEVYFDGNAGTLRDTRSATKSITGALVGIALDEKKLSGG
jgi:CubicO group peptidase (beta-lactamase class C family)